MENHSDFYSNQLSKLIEDPTILDDLITQKSKEAAIMQPPLPNHIDLKVFINRIIQREYKTISPEKLTRVSRQFQDASAFFEQNGDSQRFFCDVMNITDLPIGDILYEFLQRNKQKVVSSTENIIKFPTKEISERAQHLKDQ